MEIVKTKKGENLNKTKNIENSLQIETPCSVVVGWTSVTTTTERFPTLAEAMAISEFSFNFQILVVFGFKHDYGFVVFDAILRRWEEDFEQTVSDLLLSNWSQCHAFVKPWISPCLLLFKAFLENVLKSISFVFHLALKNVRTHPLSEVYAFCGKDNAFLTLDNPSSQADAFQFYPYLFQFSNN